MFGGHVRLRVVALLVGTFLPISSLPRGGRAPDSTQPRVRSTMRIVSQGYCLDPHQDSDNPRLGSLALLLNLRVVNISDHPIIICKKCIETRQEPTLSSVNSDGTPGQVRNGGMIIDNFAYDEPKYPGRPEKEYTILKPGDDLNVRYRTAILVTYYPSTISRMILSSGNYLLGISFRTWWSEKTDRSKTLARKWRASGELYTGILTPEAVPIRIDVPEELAICPIDRGQMDSN